MLDPNSILGNLVVAVWVVVVAAAVAVALYNTDGGNEDDHFHG